MIWVIAFFIIILISSVLAYRSMRDYEEFPDSGGLMTLFFVGNPQNLNANILERFKQKFSNHDFFSIEKLIKGKESARVIFGPKDMVNDFPELNLIEIEDYLASPSQMLGEVDYKKLSSVDHVLSWLIEPKNNPKKSLVIGQELRGLQVENDQKVFVQLVLMPMEKSSETLFQATIRIMVSDQDPIRKVELAKRINRSFADATGLSKHEDNFPESKKFDSFKQRSLIPQEVSVFPLNSEEILSLIA